jgi:hypothetical protein
MMTSYPDHTSLWVNDRRDENISAHRSREGEAEESQEGKDESRE